MVTNVDVAESIPSVIVVDDAQWIDASSLEILRFVVRRLRGWSLCLVMTWRTEEVPPAHPLRRMLADADRDGLATGVTLQRLTPSRTSTSSSASRGRTTTSPRRCSRRRPVSRSSSRSTSRAVRRLPCRRARPARVARRERERGRPSQVLTAAAVIGRAFDPRTVREASGRSEDEVVRALDELVAKRSPRRDGRRVRRHASEAARVRLRGRVARTTPPAARAHREGARRARRAGARSCMRSRRSTSSAPGTRTPRPSTSARPASTRRGVYANAEALAHLRSRPRARRAGRRAARGDRRPAHPRGPLRRSDRALREGGRSRRRCRASSDASSATSGSASAIGTRQRRTTSKAEQALGPGRERARVLAERALNAHRAGRADSARELASRASADARAADDRTCARAGAQRRGDPRVASRRCAAPRGVICKRASTSPRPPAIRGPRPLRSTTSLSRCAWKARPISRCRTRTRRSRSARRIGDRHREAAVHSNIADILHDLGRPDEAIEHLKASAAILSDVGEPDEPQPEIWKLVEW